MVEPVVAPDPSAESAVVEPMPLDAAVPALGAAAPVLDDVVLDAADVPAVVEPDEHAASPAARRITAPAVSDRFTGRCRTVMNNELSWTLCSPDIGSIIGSRRPAAGDHSNCGMQM